MDVKVKRPLNELSATEIAGKIAAGETTCEAVVRDCIARIGARDEVVKAWVNFDEKLALAQARALDGGSTRGPLHGGVPIGLKDTIDTFDMPTEMGSPIYRGNRPRADAACVALLRRAGAVILGKTATCEFAGSAPPQTTNPHNAAHTPGGSSSGSAAGVADHMVPAALGTQTGGSILRPSSFCGIFGYKPTYNTINKIGVWPAAELHRHHRLARPLHRRHGNADGRAAHGDAAAVPQAQRWAAHRSTGAPTCWDTAQPESKAAIEDAANFGKAGANVSDIDLPEAFNGLHASRARRSRFMSARPAWRLPGTIIAKSCRRRCSATSRTRLKISRDEHVAGMKRVDECRVLLGPYSKSMTCCWCLACRARRRRGLARPAIRACRRSGPRCTRRP